MNGCCIVVKTGILRGSALQVTADRVEQFDSWLNQEFSKELFPIIEDCDDEEEKIKETSETLVEDDSSRIEFRGEDELFEVVDKKEMFPSSWGMVWV